MDRFIKIFAATASALLIAGCTPEVTPVEHVAPAVNFPAESDFLTASVGSKVSIEADITAGDNLTVGWYVDEVLESSSEDFEYVFEYPGSYIVTFKASNGSGSVEKEYTVEIYDVLSISLSTADSLSVERLQGDYLKVMAIVESGVGVSHQWSVDGVVLSQDAYFDIFLIPEVGTYTVSYLGTNAVGSFSKSFQLVALDRPLEVRLSNTDSAISVKDGETVTVIAEILSGSDGLVQKWLLDGVEITSGSTFSRIFTKGSYSLMYSAVNAKGETFTFEWQVEVAGAGYLLDDFEGVTELGAIWRKGENQPGVQLADNPKKTDLNMSDKVMSNSVSGSHSTSGYFTLETSKIAAEKGIDVTKCTGIRFKVYLGKNKYYPRVDIGGTKYAPVSTPKFNDEWEYLEYRFGKTFDAGRIIQIRALLKENGSSIDAGAVSETNTRTVYFDDFEFLE